MVPFLFFFLFSVFWLPTLISLVIEENRVRSHFNAEYGAHLPEDLCLCIGNSPTRWQVVPWDGSSLEVLPSIDADLIAYVGVFSFLFQTLD